MQGFSSILSISLSCKNMSASGKMLPPSSKEYMEAAINKLEQDASLETFGVLAVGTLQRPHIEFRLRTRLKEFLDGNPSKSDCANAIFDINRLLKNLPSLDNSITSLFEKLATGYDQNKRISFSERRNTLSQTETDIIEQLLSDDVFWESLALEGAKELEIHYQNSITEILYYSKKFKTRPSGETLTDESSQTTNIQNKTTTKVRHSLQWDDIRLHEDFARYLEQVNNLYIRDARYFRKVNNLVDNKYEQYLREYPNLLNVFTKEKVKDKIRNYIFEECAGLVLMSHKFSIKREYYEEDRNPPMAYAYKKLGKKEWMQAQPLFINNPKKAALRSCTNRHLESEIDSSPPTSSSSSGSTSAISYSSAAPDSSSLTETETSLEEINQRPPMNRSSSSSEETTTGNKLSILPTPDAETAPLTDPKHSQSLIAEPPKHHKLATPILRHKNTSYSPNSRNIFTKNLRKKTHRKDEEDYGYDTECEHNSYGDSSSDSDSDKEETRVTSVKMICSQEKSFMTENHSDDYAPIVPETPKQNLPYIYPSPIGTKHPHRPTAKHQKNYSFAKREGCNHTNAFFIRIEDSKSGLSFECGSPRTEEELRIVERLVDRFAPRV